MVAAYDIHTMINEVEMRLDLPHGSIRPFFTVVDEHWVFVLKATSIIETVLKSALFTRIRPESGPWNRIVSLTTGREAALRDHLFRIPLRGEIGAVALAKAYGLLTKDDENFIMELTGIRNRYAHSILNHSKPVMTIISERKNEKQVGACLRHLRYNRDLPSPIGGAEAPGIVEIEFGLLMFLAGMSGTLKPLEAQPGGLLGDLLAKLNSETTKADDE